MLPRLFESLTKQTFSDFEWLVVDDGSTDDTADVIAAMSEAADFPVRYLYKPNGGKHTALNTGVEAAAGEYCAVIDSDDRYLPNALQILVEEWDRIEQPERFAEVQALCATADGRIVGTAFPGGERLDSDAFEIRFQHHVRGDKIGMIRTDVMRGFPFPSEFTGQFVTEALVWCRMARKYRTRYVNRVLAIVEYQAAGLSNTAPSKAIDRAGASRLFFKEIVQMGRPLPLKERCRCYANWVRNATLAGVPLSDELHAAPSRAWFLLVTPLGRGLAARDRRRAGRL